MLRPVVLTVEEDARHHADRIDAIGFSGSQDGLTVLIQTLYTAWEALQPPFIRLSAAFEAIHAVMTDPETGGKLPDLDRTSNRLYDRKQAEYQAMFQETESLSRLLHGFMALELLRWPHSFSEQMLEQDSNETIAWKRALCAVLTTYARDPSLIGRDVRSLQPSSGGESAYPPYLSQAGSILADFAYNKEYALQHVQDDLDALCADYGIDAPSPPVAPLRIIG